MFAACTVGSLLFLVSNVLKSQSFFHRPKTLLSVASCLLNERVELEAQQLYTSLSHQIVDLYSKKIDVEHVRQIQLDESRVPALTLAEIGFMVTLPTGNVDISHLAAKGLRLIALVERQPDVPVTDLLGEEELSKRNFIYEQLGDPRVVLVGACTSLALAFWFRLRIMYRSCWPPKTYSEVDSLDLLHLSRSPCGLDGMLLEMEIHLLSGLRAIERRVA